MADYPSAVTSFPTLVDLVDEILALHPNERGAEIVAVETTLGINPMGAQTDVKTRLQQSLFESYNSTVQNLTGNVTLTDASLPLLSYNPTAARDVILSTVASTNHPFYIYNRSSTYALTIKNPSSVVLMVISPLTHAAFACDGTNGWYVVAGGYLETAYKLVVSDSSNNLTLAIKHLDGTDPTTTRPLWFLVGSTWRPVTAALSVIKNAATNWCNAGSAALATWLINYFVYIGYNATDGVVIGFSRVPYARFYSDFSTTTTNEKYCAISTIAHAVATDDYVNIGRFSATLSAGSGYTWSISGTGDVINRPIDKTDDLSFTGAVSAGAGTPTNPTSLTGKYQVIGTKIFISVVPGIVNHNTASGSLFIAAPLTPAAASALSAVENAATGVVCNANYQTTPRIAIAKYDGGTVWVDGYNIPASGWASWV